MDITFFEIQKINEKMSQQIFLMTLVSKIYISEVKFFEKKYCIEFQPFFGPKMDQFFMKNDKICVVFENDRQHWMIMKDEKKQKCGTP